MNGNIFANWDMCSSNTLHDRPIRQKEEVMYELF